MAIERLTIAPGNWQNNETSQPDNSGGASCFDFRTDSNQPNFLEVPLLKDLRTLLAQLALALGKCKDTEPEELIQCAAERLNMAKWNKSQSKTESLDSETTNHPNFLNIPLKKDQVGLNKDASNQGPKMDLSGPLKNDPSQEEPDALVPEIIPTVILHYKP
ncbi:hypothetical protein Btru_053408 [Bulinus truncatus]|nr:hypothetical protein Btru_053408 [Bulinus truncatus]